MRSETLGGNAGVAGLEADVKQLDDDDAKVLDALRRAVAEALERKRRLGQYAVVWRDGRAVCVGPDAPAPAYPSSIGAPRAAGGVAEPGEK